MQHLYRHYDKDDRLLYVGVSLSVMSRLAQHRDGSHWFPDIVRVTLEPYPDRATVLAAERKAITEENPLHNLKRPTPRVVVKARGLADESRADLVRRLVQFNPTYSIPEAAEVLGVSESRVRAMIGAGEIGYIQVGEKKGSRGVYRVLRITGWQLIEYIEHLEAQS